jgi:hypothetical protein
VYQERRCPQLFEVTEKLRAKHVAGPKTAGFLRNLMLESRPALGKSPAGPPVS